MSYIGVNPQKNINPFLETKSFDSFPKNIKEEIKLITFAKDSYAMPMGSYYFRIQKYPADIDLLETFEDCCNMEDVIKKFAKRLKLEVKRIQKKKTHYFSEFKAGIDKRYDIDIGELYQGTYFPNIQLRTIIIRLYNQNLISKEDKDTILFILNKPVALDANDHDIIYYIIRNYRILRWAAKEILKGKKKLPGNKFISLENALSMKSPVKIDEIIVVNGKFMEITNFVLLGYEKNGKIIPINTTFDYTDEDASFNNIINILKNDIEKLYYSDMFYSPFKMIKRIFSLARFLDDKMTLEKIIPIISSNISQLYQMKSELEAIDLVIERNKSIPIVTINKQIDNMKNTLSTIVELDKQDLNELFGLIDEIIKTNSKNKKILLIKELKEILLHYINYDTIIYLNKMGINPPPRIYFPDTIKYDKIIRTPLDMPVNPIKYVKYQMQHKGTGLISYQYPKIKFDPSEEWLKLKEINAQLNQMRYANAQAQYDIDQQKNLEQWKLMNPINDQEIIEV